MKLHIKKIYLVRKYSELKITVVATILISLRTDAQLTAYG